MGFFNSRTERIETREREDNWRKEEKAAAEGGGSWRARSVIFLGPGPLLPFKGLHQLVGCGTGLISGEKQLNFHLGSALPSNVLASDSAPVEMHHDADVL